MPIAAMLRWSRPQCHERLSKTQFNEGSEEPSDLPSGEHRVIGAKMKTMRTTEMQMIADSMDRAAKAARNAERLSAAAALSFASEASALEQARAYMIEKLV